MSKSGRSFFLGESGLRVLSRLDCSLVDVRMLGRKLMFFVFTAMTIRSGFFSSYSELWVRVVREVIELGGESGLITAEVESVCFIFFAF